MNEDIQKYQGLPVEKYVLGTPGQIVGEKCEQLPMRLTTTIDPIESTPCLPQASRPREPTRSPPVPFLTSGSQLERKIPFLESRSERRNIL